MFWNENYIENLREHIAGQIAGFQYLADGESIRI